MSSSNGSPPIEGACEKCPQPLSEHGEFTGRCRGHARVRDEAGKATGELRPCGNRPIDGTTVCRSHGVNKQTKAAADRVVARDKAVRELKLGGRVVIDPSEAMLEAVYEAQANVELYRHLVSLLRPPVEAGVGELEGDDEDGPYMDDIDRSELGGTIAGRVDPANWKAAAHVHVVMYDSERERLMRFSKMCRDAGVEEHRVKLAERMGAQLIEVNLAVLEAFVGWALRQLEQGSLTPKALDDARRTVFPGLVRQAVEARVLGESNS